MDLYSLFDMECPPRLTEYLNYLVTVKNSPVSTVKNYKSDLKMFLRFIKKIRTKSKEDISLIDISDVDDMFLQKIMLNELYMFTTFLTIEKKAAQPTRARKIIAIRSFFKYLNTKAKVLTNNVALELEIPKKEKRNPVYLTLDESKTLLAAPKGRQKKRDYCIITLFLNCGLRLSELVGINISNIKQDTLTVIGKGNKERTVYLNDACIKAINDYLEVREIPKPGHEDALFLSQQKQRISDRAVQELIGKHFKEANITGKKYTPHKLRHTAATLLYKYANVDIRTLKEILGHEDVSTTQIYTHVDDESLREAVKANPLANIEGEQ